MLVPKKERKRKKSPSDLCNSTYNIECKTMRGLLMHMTHLYLKQPDHLRSARWLREQSRRVISSHSGQTSNHKLDRTLSGSRLRNFALR